MARDHRKHTRNFPRDEWYGLRLQVRKAAVSMPSNLVEGNARRTTREYVNFINISRASAAELTYLVDLASELGYLTGAVFKELNTRCERVCAQLEALLQAMELLMIEEAARRRVNRVAGRRSRREGQRGRAVGRPEPED